MLDRRKAIDWIGKDHEDLKRFLKRLSNYQLTEVKLTDLWTTKDILAHLAAWNWEVINEIDLVLLDKASWPGKYESEKQEEEFNKMQIEKQKDKTLDEIIQEWENAHQAVFKKLESLTEKEWYHQSGNQIWTQGRLKNEPVTASSLFDYEYGGKSHEAGHADQIKKQFKNSLPTY